MSEADQITRDFVATISGLLSEISRDNVIEKCQEIIEISESMKNTLVNLKQDNSPHETPIILGEKTSLPEDSMSRDVYDDFSEDDYSNSS